MLQEYVNRIKCEGYESFNDSVFKTVYADAVSMTRAIISANQYYEKNTGAEMEKFCNENHIASIISFLGDRGVGKSSAMLSYAHFLSRYSKTNIDENNSLFLAKQVGFCVLPKIDVTMLAHGEGLFEVVLAKMWDMFWDKVNSSVKKEIIQETVRKKFESVKQSYNRWNTTLKESGVSQLAELHGLSQSLNLRADFSELISAFSEYMGKEKNGSSYLVFAIDDLDMVIESAYVRLEELRLFLTIPNVIVLVTADIDYLILSTQNAWKMKLGMLPDTKEVRDYTLRLRVDEQADDRLARDYAVKYLAKVLPRNMRIFMPDSSQTTDKGLQSLYVGVAQKLFAGKRIKGLFTRQKLVEVFLRKQTGMILHYNMLNEAEQKYSLRDTVDTLAELGYIISNINIDDTIVENWLKKEIYTATKRLEEKKHEEFVTKVIGVNANLFDRYFSRFYVELKDKSMPKSKGSDYRGTIEKLVYMYNEKIDWAEFVKILMWIYGLKTYERLDGYQKEQRDKEMPKNFFLDVLLEKEFMTIYGPENYVKECFDAIAELDISSEVRYGELDQLFHTLLFYDMDVVLNNMEIEEVSERKITLFSGEEREINKVIWEGEENVRGTASFYWFFENIFWYDKRRNAFIEWLNRIWQENYFGVLEYEQRTQESKMVAENVSEWRNSFLETRTERDKELSILDIIPIHCIGMMMEICNKIFILISDGEQITEMSDCLEALIEIIQNVYEETEAYYNVVDAENDECYKTNYAKVFKELIAALDIKEISNTYFVADVDWDLDLDLDLDDDISGDMDKLGG